MENYKNVSQDIRDQLNAKAEAVQIILTGIDNDIYSTVDACPNACEMWKAIERLKHGESINIQDLETNLYWEFRKFTSRDDESLESYYSRFYKMMNELVGNQCDSQELKTVSYHKLYDILKQHQNEVNELRAERLARTANPLALVAQQQPVYHPQTHHTHYTQNSSTRSQQAATKNRGKAIVNSPPPIYDQEPSMVAKDDKMSKDKEIDKLMALISLSFKKIYKPTNNNLRTSSNTSRVNQDNSIRINRGTRYESQRIGNVAGARETVEQADWRDDTDDESEDQELEAHYMYMAQIQEVSPDAADDSGPIFDSEPLQKVIIDSLDMSYDREKLDHDDDDDLANERELLSSLIEKLKCEIDDSKNRNKFLETSNKRRNDRRNDLKKFQEELDRRNDVKYASKSEGHNCNASGPSKLYAQGRSKCVSRSLMIARGVPNLAKKDFKNLQTTRALLVGSAFASTHFDKHFITLRNLSLALTSVTRFDQVVGITIDCRPIKTRVKHLFGGVVRAMMSPDGSIVASLKNINGFLAVNTPPDDLIRTDFEQERVVPKVMLHIFKEFVLLLGRHPFHNKVPRMVVCKISKCHTPPRQNCEV
nr:hypothetical protein [Tanacetum cinerariifolium]